MVNFIDFAISDRRFTSIKEGLKAFRSIAQTVAVNSLEEVLEYYKERMEDLFYDKCAKAACSEQQLAELEDIELEATADELLEGTIDISTK
jgi:hypothetical protein